MPQKLNLGGDLFMRREKVARNVMLYLFAVMMLMVVGCGGGGGGDNATTGSTISGVAAAGAPIVGKVTLKDSKGVEKVVTIAADGKYSIDVTGLTPPFALRADGDVGGQEYHLYSAAVESDINKNINITPFTDLIVANMARQIAENYYKSGNFSSLNEANLAAAQTALQTKLQTVLTAMGLGAAIDLLRTSFNTDHTGLDAVIDVVQVSVDPATVQATLTNVVNKETMLMNIAAGGTTSDTFTGKDLNPEVGADLQQIEKMWKDFIALYATALPTEAQLAVFCTDANTFIDNGQNLQETLTDMTTSPKNIGMKFVSMALVSLDTTKGTAVVTLTVQDKTGANNSPDEPMHVIKQNGKWLWSGNGRIAGVRIRPYALYFQGGTQIHTGLNLSVDRAGASVQSAVVTGSGLPDAGVILNKQINNGWFVMLGNGGNCYWIADDAVIGNIADNSVYTTKLYSGANGTGTLLATYTNPIYKRPLKRSELSGANFPAITAPTQATLAAFTSGNLNVTWTLPSGHHYNWLQLRLYDANWTNTVSVESDGLTSTATSATLTVTAPSFPVAYRQLSVTAQDVYGRRFQTILQ
jgi:hypothetical protein